jgi:hypothetical protein
LLDVDLQEMEEKTVSAQQLPFFDGELSYKTFVELRVGHNLHRGLTV